MFFQHGLKLREFQGPEFFFTELFDGSNTTHQEVEILEIDSSGFVIVQEPESLFKIELFVLVFDFE